MLGLGSKEGLECCFPWTSSCGKGADSVLELILVKVHNAQTQSQML